MNLVDYGVFIRLQIQLNSLPHEALIHGQSHPKEVVVLIFTAIWIKLSGFMGLWCLEKRFVYFLKTLIGWDSAWVTRRARELRSSAAGRQVRPSWYNVTFSEWFIEMSLLSRCDKCVIIHESLSKIDYFSQCKQSRYLVMLSKLPFSTVNSEIRGFKLWQTNHNHVSYVMVILIEKNIWTYPRQ